MNKEKIPDTDKNDLSPKPRFTKVLKKSALSFLAMSPMLVGVIGLVGLFQVLVTPQMLASVFWGNPLIDTLSGLLAGSFAVGTPIVSYIMGGELLGQGISLFAVTAFILSWVSLGFIQLPAEVGVFGSRFTFRRNILALIFTIIIAILTPLTLQILS